MHGAVLAKICRNDPKITLSLIETRDDKRSAYLINDWLVIIKYSITPTKDDDGSVTWIFTVTTDTVDLLQKTLAEREVYIVLACALYNQLRYPWVEVCLMEPHDIRQCLYLDQLHTAQWLRVKYQPRHRLRVWGPANNGEPCLIERKKIENWKLPGR